MLGEADATWAYFTIGGSKHAITLTSNVNIAAKTYSPNQEIHRRERLILECRYLHLEFMDLDR